MDFLNRNFTKFKRWYIANQDNVDKFMLSALMVVMLIFFAVFTFLVIVDTICIMYSIM